MSEIENLAKRGAALLAKLKAGEDPKAREELNRIAAQIESSWGAGDVTIESWHRARVAAAKASDIGDELVLVRVNGTQNHVTVSPGFGHRLINYHFERKNY
jgi:hypothetical protein